MFRIDEGANTAILLRFGNNVERERSLARRFWAEDLNNSAARDAADS